MYGMVTGNCPYLKLLSVYTPRFDIRHYPPLLLASLRAVNMPIIIHHLQVVNKSAEVHVVSVQGCIVVSVVSVGCAYSGYYT